MKSSRIILGFIVIGIGVSFFYLFNGGEGQAYIDEIIRERKDKDDFMRNSDASPFRAKKDSCTPLKYFAPDMKYRLQASLNYIQAREMLTLSTNDSKSQSYLAYAWAEFDLDNLHNKLLILEIAEGEENGKLFLAFADQTSANETYGAGRYLDVKKVPGANSISLDFNKAYNPYCAYTDSYSCPLPPKENLLKVSILAGEKTYH